MAKPKLALIPAAQGSKFYSVLPSDGVGDFDFARASAATRINKYGLIETVASSQSRLNYPLIDGVVKGCPHHLLEPSRTNYITQSIDLADWLSYVPSGTVTRTNDYSTSPDGLQKATRLQMSGGSSTQWTHLNVSNLATYASFYVKSTGSSSQNFRWFWNNGGGGQDFTATTEWQRFEVAVSQASSLPMGFTTHSDLSASDILVWGVQSENGSYATSYIPTSGSTVTRVAETANGAGDASTFNDSEGVLMAEISALANDLTNRRITIDDGTGNNRIILGYYSASNSLLIDVASQGTAAYTKVAYVPDVTNFNKIALKYKENDFALWVNGFEIDVDLSGITPINLNNLKFDGGSGAVPFYGNTKQIQYFDSALNDSELETLTSWVSFQDMAEGQLYTIE